MGMRPSVYRLASALELGGMVRNELGSVWIEVEGPQDRVSAFVRDLPGSLALPARVDELEASPLAPLGEDRFVIAETLTGAATAPPAAIPADLGPCDACLRELEDPDGRRHRHPFINCTSCGPRYTVVRSLPYGRERTAMRPFTLCDPCAREFEDPADRRFHAEPSSCPTCGPRLSFVHSVSDERAFGEEALSAAAKALRSGAIVAVKGAGGFVLACDATRDEAVAKLRERKHRPHKPFAVMGRDLAALEAVALLDDDERSSLRSPERPIVLCRKRDGSPLSSRVAPALGDVGVFLPPTPLQHLLLADGPPLQVMTSGNRGGAPIARTNDEALAALHGIADAFLLHDREIEVRADDSVVRMIGRERAPIRRARGFVPDSIRLPVDGPPLLAVGAGEKNTVCLAGGGRAWLSPHLGDLDHPDVLEVFREAIARLSRFAGIQPTAVVHDLHPDLRSTRWARESGLPCIPVQHHHAHVASCLAEHGRTGPVLGVAFDGTGLGTDGTMWGGEILLADLQRCERIAHLRPLPLAGGEAAIRQPWRLALAALLDAGESVNRLKWVGPRLEPARRILEHGSPPLATGAGRWLDGVASLCRLREEITYEGQAATELESAASSCPPQPAFAFDFTGTRIDLRPAIRELVRELDRGVGVPVLAARFHATLAAAIHVACRRARDEGGPSVVALTGGCFQNRRLSDEATAHLESDGFEVLHHRLVPANDGGISLGQAAIGSRLLAERPPGRSD
ncbi:[NiFe] hydrogenase metallocenter assembly protein HypF [Vulgatibacter incomptus]|uniref:Carbamoyltransferase n=1 Tax=Vulgatibacter incomptus TaxID=1391653 RepID=A0A0K1P9N1_9BACT|nr:[NiFe] hydrogenase metallocenter assembly protein HypF [Vulgatibacter incomptus]